ncbi:MAG: Threonyl-tRNA synthetase [Candidatus Methanohalarchaeum thermophilum]|uniref:Threonine--tRNA ligase n=1 Tax=Methanohalarchaeum thermophilum TaxID=1903181 RepID=A0A1Q6DVQ3_METT1|nr:MAG: Threonyl-tRNA synthetase [Candidatus Methanohalarchaeum thermophilum]
MKLLLIHSDHFEYEVTEKTNVAEEISEELKKGKMEEVLACFITVESIDEKDPDQIVEKSVNEIEDTLNKVNAEGVFLYPYAHLSQDLGSPEVSVKILKRIEEKLRDNEIKTKRSPFGWYKAFEIKCKGHPLSELSRKIIPEEEEEDEEKGEEKRKVESKYFILTPNEREIKLDNLDQVKEEEIPTGTLKDYIYSEELEKKSSEKPPSVDSMRHLEIADYEEASDPGNLRLYPKGKLIFNLLEDWSDEIAVDRLDAVEIDTPILYDWSQPDIQEQGESFHERHYRVFPPEKDDELVLRFAGDFGLFRMLKEAILSYRNLPLRIYEFSKSFRYEKRGELSGLKRLRTFHMPDIHSFTTNLSQGWKEYQKLFKEYDDLAKGTNIEYAVVFRVVEEFYEENKDKIFEMLKYSDKPAFVEVLSERKHYWVVKHEFQGIDSTKNNTQLATVQLDIEDAERYDITYTTKEGNEEGCTICHSSIGSIERWMYSILEEAHKMEKPKIPIWLCPTQIRLLTISEDNLEYANKIKEKLKEEGIRVDIDDRNERLGKKIREAEKEWIPYIGVIGDDEEKEDFINLRIREQEKEEKFEVEEIVELIKEKLEGKPNRKLPLPDMLSKRPKFVG